MIRPDALLQGLGCVVTGVGTLYGLTFAASETSNPTLTFVLVALALQVPCCLCCGALMVWSGAGGSLPDAIPPALRARVRCDADDLCMGICMRPSGYELLRGDHVDHAPLVLSARCHGLRYDDG